MAAGCKAMGRRRRRGRAAPAGASAHPPPTQPAFRGRHVGLAGFLGVGGGGPWGWGWRGAGGCPAGVGVRPGRGYSQYSNLGTTHGPASPGPPVASGGHVTLLVANARPHGSGGRVEHQVMGGWGGCGPHRHARGRGGPQALPTPSRLAMQAGTGGLPKHLCTLQGSGGEGERRGSGVGTLTWRGRGGPGGLGWLVLRGPAWCGCSLPRPEA